MRYKVIKGSFYVSGYSPDGDSIRFQADNQEHWDFFEWKQKKNKNQKKKQLRFEAIDALETHYEESHQPRSFGVAALEVLLKMLGIDKVIYNIAITKITSATDGTTGFIASTALDIYDRPISLVFSEDTHLEDGQVLSAAGLPLDLSINLKLLKLGLVYPTFYSSMEQKLINIFSRTTKKARNNKIGVWALDKTHDFTLWNKDTIQNDIVILPKIFRRLTCFFIKESNYDALYDYLKKTGDKVLISSTGEKKKLYEIMQIEGRRIKFFEKPEDLIFDPKG
jgi:endonuclease YncB( thermonuclease family)